MTYEEALRCLTTYPYWQCFDAISGKELPGAPDLTLIRGPSGEPSGLQHLGMQRSLGISAHIRYCSDCLQEDLALHGEVYWHRSHQLPNVFHCPKHQTRLRIDCPACKRRVGSNGWFISAPREVCLCGRDLRLRDRGARPNPEQVLLARLSVQALESGIVGPGCEKVLGFFAGLLKVGDRSPEQAYREKVGRAFGLVQLGGLMVDASSSTRVTEETFRVTSQFARMRTPDFLATLAALRVPFKDAAVGALTAEPWLPRSHRAWPNTWTIKSARVAISAGDVTTDARRARHGRLPYWFLRLNDPKWLEQYFPEASRPIPSVAADRRELGRRFAEMAAQAAMACGAGHRARLRDKDWLISRWPKAERRGKHQLSLVDARSAAMLIELQHILKTEGRPAHTYAWQLGAITGLTRSQSNSSVSPALSAAINRANADRPRRALHWAMKSLLDEGRHPSMAATFRRSMLTGTKDNVQLYRTLYEELRQVRG